jgi:hypothetical protein
MIANLRRFLTAVPAVTIALLSHAGACPACWPLIGGLVASLGLTFLVETRYLLPLMIGCLAIAIAALSYPIGRDYRPLIVGVAASGVILIGKFILDASLVTVAGAGLLVGAYLWSFWLRRSDKASSCQSCCAPEAAATGKSTMPEKATNTDIPIACTLNQTQFAERKELVKRLAQEAKERRKLPHGVGLSFEPVSSRVTELARLVDLERTCCPFLRFRIEAPAGGAVWLELTGPATAQEIIRELIPVVGSND